MRRQIYPLNKRAQEIIAEIPGYKLVRDESWGEGE